MAARYKQYKIKNCLFLFILASFVLCAVTVEGKVKKPTSKAFQGTVVLDPGHGGHETGTQGPGGTLEKTVTLLLARMIADELGDQYLVVLTRTDDYSLGLYGRAAAANNIKADIFISLHTGGSFLHEASGMSVVFFKEVIKPAMTPEAIPKKHFENKKANINWDTIQNKYITKSKVLAQLIQDRLLGHSKFKKSRIQSAPLLVLKGAEMPAILIEIGYLTNPVEENALREPNVLSDLAKGISKGINDFFQEK